MPNIVLKEQDLTTVAVAAESTNVVFVPGIADTNFNCYICNVPDVTPKGNTLIGLAPTKYAKGDTIHRKNNGKYGQPSIFVNTFDKKAWMYTGNTVTSSSNYDSTNWVEMEYSAISPVNQPTYVDNIVDFNSLFGSKAYTWDKENYGGGLTFTVDVDDFVEGSTILGSVNVNGTASFYTNESIGPDEGLVGTGAVEDGICSEVTLQPHITVASDEITNFVSGATTVTHTPVASFGGAYNAENIRIDEGTWEIDSTTGIVEASGYVSGYGAEDVARIAYSYSYTYSLSDIDYAAITIANDSDADITNAFNNARILPTFTENELPGNASDPHYFYNNGDIEKSWLYAKEMIYAGLPVFFEDVAPLANVNTKSYETIPVYVKMLPSLNAFYDSLASALTGKPDEVGYDGTHGIYANYELLDVGEYNFKYVTSGGYPVFNAIVDARSIVTTEEIANFVSGATVVANLPIDSNATPTLLGEGEVKVGTATIDEYGVITAIYDDGYDADDVVAIKYAYLVGGSPMTIVTNMMTLCTQRGECYAIIDHADNVLRPWYGSKSLFNALQKSGIGDMGSRAGMFTPWATYSMDTNNSVVLMPGSFGYLRTLAYGIRSNDSYLAYAGVNRGGVRGIIELHCMYPLTNTVANDLQTKDGYSINPITFIKPYGLTIWGNRTLLKAENGLKATNFLNVRNLVCEVQKTAYNAAKVCLFENDNLGTWVKFTNPISELLTSMQNSGSLKAFSIRRVPTAEKAVINAEIRIIPTYAVEEFNITVILLDDGDVTVEIE